MDDTRILLDQLSEVLDSDPEDWDDALEVAIVAGQLARRGERGGALLRAELWRDGAGRSLLDEAWEEVDLDEVVGRIEDLAHPEVEAEELEEAIYDLDDVVAAAVWCGATAAVLGAVDQVAELVAQRPDVFAPLYDEATGLCRLPEIARHAAAYGFWFAMQHVEEE